jgi:hypothetical protein
LVRTDFRMKLIRWVSRESREAPGGAFGEVFGRRFGARRRQSP